MGLELTTVCARLKDRDSNDEFNRADGGDGNPGGDISAGIAGEVVSEERAQGEAVTSVVDSDQ
jgi:hypothetical protein